VLSEASNHALLLRPATHFQVESLSLNSLNLFGALVVGGKLRKILWPFYFARQTTETRHVFTHFTCLEEISREVQWTVQSQQTLTSATASQQTQTVDRSCSWDCFSHLLSTFCYGNILQAEISIALKWWRLKSQCQTAFPYRSTSLWEHLDTWKLSKNMKIRRRSLSEVNEQHSWEDPHLAGGWAHRRFKQQKKKSKERNPHQGFMSFLSCVREWSLIQLG